MVQNEFITKKKINIKVILKPDSNIEFFKQIFTYISDYLNLNVVYIDNFLIKNNNPVEINENSKIDYYFVDFVKSYEYIFAWNFYSKLHDLNKDFKLVLFKDKIDENDVKYFKNGVDDIIYIGNSYYENNIEKEKYIRWKIFSLLRRRWDDNHSQLVLIRNGIIIDLIKRKVVINNKEIKITNKEFEILSILVEEFYKKNNFTSKKKLFKKIYGIDNIQNSRAIDQLIFKLKNKFSKDFFEINKQKGIKIS